MDNILGLTKHASEDKLDDLSNILFKSVGIPCRFNSKITYTEAGTSNDKYGYPEKVCIGIYEIEHAKGSWFHQPDISDKLFTTVVLNMYHERCHCYQKGELFRRVDLNKQEQQQLIQEIACAGNYDYYFNDNGNYRVNASEIQAEKEGIYNTYEYLCNEFPNVDAKEHERIILNIVNNKMMTSSYFVEQSTPFTSLQEVEDAFDDAYDTSFTKDREYYVGSEHTQDAVKQYMQTHKDARKVYLSLHDSLEKDRCIAVINLKLHPEWLEQYPALKDMDLSYEHVIEYRYAELVSKGKAEPEKIYERTYEEARQRNFGTENEPVKVPVQKHYDEKDLKGLSRMEQLEMKFGHLMQEETTGDEYEK